MKYPKHALCLTQASLEILPQIYISILIFLSHYYQLLHFLSLNLHKCIKNAAPPPLIGHPGLLGLSASRLLMVAKQRLQL